MGNQGWNWLNREVGFLSPYPELYMLRLSPQSLVTDCGLYSLSARTVVFLEMNSEVYSPIAKELNPDPKAIVDC